jgi:hypothetical protein
MLHRGDGDTRNLARRCASLAAQPAARLHSTVRACAGGSTASWVRLAAGLGGESGVVALTATRWGIKSPHGERRLL